jgi:hypothetical protein
MAIKLMFVIWFLLAIGWVTNIVRLCCSNFDAPYKNEAIRIVGIIVPPVGGVVGYINIED